jgi:hypothetical protein
MQRQQRWPQIQDQGRHAGCPARHAGIGWQVGQATRSLLNNRQEPSEASPRRSVPLRQPVSSSTPPHAQPTATTLFRLLGRYG